MHRHVEQLLGRLATDPQLRRRFAANPGGLLRELVECELTEIELDALSKTDPQAIDRFAATLDARLRKTLLADDLASTAIDKPHPTIA